MTPSDFAAIPQDVKEAMLDLWKRLPEEWWSDARALLVMAEARGLPGCLGHGRDHDARGVVSHVSMAPEWHRQAKRRTA